MIEFLLGVIAVELFVIISKLDDVLPIEIRFIGENGDHLRIIKEVGRQNNETN